MADRTNVKLEQITFVGAYPIEYSGATSWVWTGPQHHCQLTIFYPLDAVEALEIVVDNNLEPQAINSISIMVEQRRVIASMVPVGKMNRIIVPISGRSIAKNYFDVVMRVSRLTTPPRGDGRPALGVCIHKIFVHIKSDDLL